MNPNTTAELIVPVHYSSQKVYRITVPIDVIRAMQLQGGDYVRLQITPVLRPTIPTSQS